MAYLLHGLRSRERYEKARRGDARPQQSGIGTAMALPLISFVAPGTLGDVLPLLTVAEAVAETGLARIEFACHGRYQTARASAFAADSWAWRELSAAGDPETSRGGDSVRGDAAEAIWDVQLAEYEQCVGCLR